MLQPGYILSDRYKMVKPLGQGGQSNVYLLMDTRLRGKKWVCKEFIAQYTDPRDQALAKKHFEREAQLLANLDHPNLPKVNDYFAQGGRYYIVMEYVPGEDLGKMLSRTGKPFAEEKVAAWALQIATVLYYLHSQKEPIIFRDIKPANIMINGMQVKLIDFGIARLFDPAKKGDTLRIGSPGYSPPEQYSGQTDPRSDIYSLGVTMHHLLTGHDPSKTQTPFNLPPVKALNPAVSSKMIHIVETATQIDAAKRYQSAVELKNALKDLLNISRTQLASSDRTVTTVRSKTVKAQPQPASTDPKAQSAPKAGQSDKKNRQKQNSGSHTLPAVPKQTAQKQAQPAKVKKKSSFFRMLLILLVFGGLTYAGYAFLSGQLRFADISKFFARKPSNPSSSMVPENAPPYEKGIAFYNLGLYREAVAEFQKARQKDSSSPEIKMHYNNAVAHASGTDFIIINILLTDKGKGISNNSFLAGAVLAQEQINNEGGIIGKQVLLSVYSITGKNRTVDRDAVSTALSDNPAAVLIEDPGILDDATRMMTLTGKIPVLGVGSHHPYKELPLFTGNIPHSLYLQALAKFLADSGIESYAFIYDEIFKDSSETFLSDSNLKNKIIMPRSFARGTLNFDNIIREIEEAKPGGIIVNGSETDLSLLIISLRKSGINSRVYLPLDYITDEFLTGLKGSTQNLAGISPFYSGPEGYRSSNFISLYNENFGVKLSGNKSAFGYDFIQLIAKAGRNSIPDNDKILRYLSNDELVKNYRGVMGSLQMTGIKNNWQFIPEYWGIMESENGVWKQTGGFKYQ
jgi:serine/threonine protein kinase/ABC-type branched-subunit amino acid transport system substrate-binding protein